MKPRSDSIQEIMINSYYFYDIPPRYEANDHKKVWKDNTEAILKDIIVLYESSEIQNSQNLEKLFKSFIQTSGFGFGQVMKPIRLALCGSLTGPSLFELMELLGVEESIKRISIYISKNKNE
jgi:glutamyl-tRNA synthetase